MDPKINENSLITDEIQPIKKGSPQGAPDNGNRPPEPRGVMNPIHCLNYALKKAPEKVIFFPLMPTITDMVRQNDKRPAMITFATDDELVQNIKGDQEKVHLYAIIRIERDIVDEYQEMKDSRIIRPDGMIARR